MEKRILNLVHIIIPLFILHTIEELATDFYQTDASISYIGRLINSTPEITYFLIQILAYVFLAVILISILTKRTSYFLVIPLMIISIYEFIHIYEALKIGTYSSGLATGTILGALGLLLLYYLLNSKGKPKLI